MNTLATNWVDRLYQAPPGELAGELVHWPAHVWQGEAVVERLFQRNDPELTQAVVEHLGPEQASAGHTFASTVMKQAYRSAAVLLGYEVFERQVPSMARSWAKTSQWEAFAFLLPHLDVPRHLNETGAVRSLILNAPESLLVQVLAQTPQGTWKRSMFQTAMDLEVQPTFLSLIQNWGHPLSRRQATAAMVTAALHAQEAALDWLWGKGLPGVAVRRLVACEHWDGVDRLGRRLDLADQQRLLDHHGESPLPLTQQVARARQRQAQADSEAPARARQRPRA